MAPQNLLTYSNLEGCLKVSKVTNVDLFHNRMQPIQRALNCYKYSLISNPKYTRAGFHTQGFTLSVNPELLTKL